MKKHFWTTETDKHINDWLTTGDNDLFYRHIYTPLRYTAQYVMNNCIGRKIGLLKAGYSIEDIESELVSFMVAKLNEYDSALTPSAYVYCVFHAKRKINTMTIHIDRLKRVAAKELIHYQGETDDYVDKLGFTLPSSWMNENAEFIDYMLGYWTKNAKYHFRGKRLAVCKMIIQIIQKPEAYPYRGCSYLIYIAGKMKTSRQAINQVVQYMRSYNRLLHNRYLRNGLLGLL